LLEGQRSNLALWSENFDNAGWAKQNSAVTANQIVSPTGYQDADLYTTTGTSDYVQQGVSATSGTAYTCSVFIKSGTTDVVGLVLTGAAFPVAPIAEYNLTSKTATVTAGTATASIEDYGNGWLRCIVTATAANTGTLTFRLVSLSGSAVSTLYLFGAQVEAGSYASSYLNTLSTSVTRVADAASKTGISSLIGQTEGTIFAEVDMSNWETSSRILAISDGTSSNRVIIITNSSKRFRALASVGGTSQVDVNTTTQSDGVHKLALAYAENDFAFYLDGVQIATDTSALVPACTNVYVGKVETSSDAQILGNGINQALLFKTRLSNSDLATLTQL
jgi:hypothetical protein